MPYKDKRDLYRSQIARWQRIKDKAIAHKGGACSRCGYNRCRDALEFHHMDPRLKEIGISWNRLRLRSWDKIVFELDKCALLCANCHRETHHALSC